jgi:hypothetical protein
MVNEQDREKSRQTMLEVMRYQIEKDIEDKLTYEEQKVWQAKLDRIDELESFIDELKESMSFIGGTP